MLAAAGDQPAAATKTVLILCLPLYRPAPNPRFSPLRPARPPVRQTNITTNLYGLYNTRVSVVEEVRIYFVYARESQARPTPPCRRDRRIRAYGLIIFSLAAKRETLTHARPTDTCDVLFSVLFITSVSPAHNSLSRSPTTVPPPLSVSPTTAGGGATSPHTIQ